MKKILFVVTEDEYFFTHRLQNAIFAVENGYTVGVICRNTKYKNEISNNNIIFFDWSLSRGSKNIFREFKPIFQLYKCIKVFKPNLLHTVSWKPSIYTSFINLFYKKNHLIALGGLGFFYISNSFFAKIFKYLFLIYLKKYFKLYNSYLLLQNNDDKKIFIENNIIKNSKVFIIDGVGVNHKKFKVKNIKNEKNIILYAGRLILHKGLEDFFFLAKKIKFTKPHLRFVLVGKIDYHNPSFVSQKKLNEWIKSGLIEWWGFKENMENVYPEAMLTCFLSSREGFSKSLIESFSCGIPAIGYDVPGINNIIKNNENGILVKYKDHDELFKKVRYLIDHKNKISSYGSNARNIVEKKYSTDIINKKFISLWKQFLNN